MFSSVRWSDTTKEWHGRRWKAKQWTLESIRYILLVPKMLYSDNSSVVIARGLAWAVKAFEAVKIDYDLTYDQHFTLSDCAVWFIEVNWKHL